MSSFTGLSYRHYLSHLTRADVNLDAAIRLWICLDRFASLERIVVESVDWVVDPSPFDLTHQHRVGFEALLGDLILEVDEVLLRDRFHLQNSMYKLG